MQGVGLKYDTGKLRFSLLTRGMANALRSIAAVLSYGAIKYKPDSWKSVPDAQERYEDALDRHTNAWKAGEQSDPESGLSHLTHMAVNTLFLLELAISKRDGTVKDHYFNFNDPLKKVGNSTDFDVINTIVSGGGYRAGLEQ